MEKKDIKNSKGETFEIHDLVKWELGKGRFQIGKISMIEKPGEDGQFVHIDKRYLVDVDLLTKYNSQFSNN